MSVIAREVVLHRDLGLVVSLWNDVIVTTTLRQWDVVGIVVLKRGVVVDVVIAPRQWHVETLEGGEVTRRYWSSLRLMSRSGSVL